MQKIVDELKQLIPLKDTTEVGDIVVIAAKEPQLLVYARVNGIERDPGRRDEWWHVQLTMLSIPLQHMTWTLRTEQLSGLEIFTMGGEERFVKAVDFGAGRKKTTSPKALEKRKSPLKRIK